MKMLIAGSWAEDYPRNKVLLKSLKKNFTAEEVNVYGKKFRQIKFFSGLLKEAKGADCLFIVQPAQKFLAAVFLFKIFTGKKIIFDAFTSVYDTYVFDRQLARAGSLKAFYYYLLDYFFCRLSDIMIFDTEEHKNFFFKAFRLKKKKYLVLPVSVDTGLIDGIEADEAARAIFAPGKFNVLFYGHYIPLHGAEYIVEAAKILRDREDINFVMIGSGQERKKITGLAGVAGLKNILFIEKIIPFADLIARIKAADLCLGVFGGSDKAARVIPNKVLDYMACGQAVITAGSPAIRRYFKDGRDVIYAAPADAADLAAKIAAACGNRPGLAAIGKNARAKVMKNFSIESLSNLAKELKF